MANITNNERLRRKMKELGLSRPVVLLQWELKGYKVPKITLDAWLSKVGTKLHRNGPPTILIDILH